MRRVQSIGATGRTLIVSTIAVAGAASVSEAGTVTITGVNLSVSSTVDMPDREEVSDSKTSTTIGNFEDAARASDTGEGFEATSTTGVKAELGQEGFFFNTTTEFEVQDTRPPTEGNFIANRFDYQVDFTIDSPYEVDLSTEVTPGGATWSDLQGDRRLSGTTTGGESVLFMADESGVLQPGTYTLHLQQSNERRGAGETTLTTGSIEYEDSLALSPLDSGPGGEPNPIPLPPAVWSGLAVLGAGAAGRLWKRRR